MAKLKAKVARTAKGLQHVNSLRVAEFGVTELRLKSAGGKTSASRALVEGKPKKEPGGTGSDDFHFAPGVEKVTIAWRIADPFRRIEKARLELFQHGEAKALWTRDLKPEELTEGDHAMVWDGAIDKVNATPYAFDHVTAELSPYKLKLTVAGADGFRGEPPAAFTYFQVLVKELAFELGDKAVLGDPKDQALFDTLGGTLPAAGATLKVKLQSNLYKTSGGEMEDNTSYLQYQTLWKAGPQIPLFLKVSLSDSNDAKVDAPKGIGNLKILWDWEDVAEDTSGHHAKAKAFIDDALDFDKSKTKPKGDNGHLERGGKRGPDAAATFPEQPGYAPAATLTAGKFPFKVEKPKTRTWAAVSWAWPEGKLAGKTGVLLQPSRMAGDAVKVTASLAYHLKPDKSPLLDVVDDAPLKAALSKATGTFAIWRRIQLIQYLKKKAAVLPEISVATVQAAYEKAALEFENKAGAPGAMAKATYNAQVTTVSGAQPWYVQRAIDTSKDQYDVGEYFLHYRDHAGWTAQVDAHAAAQHWSAAFKATVMAGLSNATGSDPYANPNVYYQFLYDWALTMIPLVCDKFLHASDGVNIFHFNNLYNTTLPRSTDLNGFAADLPSANRNRCGFIQCGSNYGGPGNLNTREQTCTHEIGHHLFLPHTWQVSATHDPQGTHDRSDNGCTMSYNFAVARQFCGFCLLRLRGWSKFKTDKAGVPDATRTITDTGPNKRT